MKISAPPSKLDARELRRWRSLSDAAVDDLAEGSYGRALDKLRSAQAISRQAIDELNRNAERSRRVLDTCLYIVRAELATQSTARARSVARECRQLVPRGQPSAQMHPPAVTELLNQVDALQAKQTGELRVESSPSGCAARLNGLLLGETPVSVGDLFPGDYRVQVECSPQTRGRLHVVAIGVAETLQRVDSRFDDVLQSRPTLALEYPNASEARNRRVLDARRLATEIGASAVIVVSSPSEATMELDLVEVDGTDASLPGARALVSAGADGPLESDLRAAARALVDRRCMNFTSATPAALPCRDGAPAAAVSGFADRWPADRRPRGQFIAGLTLVGVGVASLTTGYALLAPRRDAALGWVNQVDTGGEDTSSQQKWLGLNRATVATGSVGAAALVAAMPLALPERNKTPWWAWVSGGVGLGLAAFSIAWGVTAEAAPSTSCSSQVLDSVEVRSCINRGKRTSVAVLTGLTSAPLITMPLVYLLRPSRAQLEPRVAVGRSGAHLALRGRF
jgi:hypothetical protein